MGSRRLPVHRLEPIGPLGGLLKGGDRRGLQASDWLKINHSRVHLADKARMHGLARSRRPAGIHPGTSSFEKEKELQSRTGASWGFVTGAGASPSRA